MKPHIVVFSGAGISAESGIKTFRDNDGLWENHSIHEVATPEAWQKNPELVLEFYNVRREQVLNSKPNAAHLAITELQNHFEVNVITQNIDNLHEQANNKNILHLHGEITKARSTANPNLIYNLGGPKISLGDTCELGSQLRPHIVWFGEAVPMIVPATEIIEKANIVIVVGSSLVVYPAAGLLEYAPIDSKIYVIDPSGEVSVPTQHKNITFINEKASLGLPKLAQKLIEEYA